MFEGMAMMYSAFRDQDRGETLGKGYRLGDTFIGKDR